MGLLANADMSNVTNLGALKDFKYQFYSTEENTYSVSAPGNNVWFDLSNVNITVEKSGLYLIIASIRFWQSTTSDSKWKTNRILLNGNELFTFFGLNPTTTSSNLDGTITGVHIATLSAGDVLQAQGYIDLNQSGDVYYSDINGSSTLTIIKIGEY